VYNSFSKYNQSDALAARRRGPGGGRCKHRTRCIILRPEVTPATAGLRGAPVRPRSRRFRPPPRRPAIDTPSNLHTQLAGQVLSYIQSNRLEPSSHLAETALCEHFKVSRTPLRAALSLLQERGYLEHIPRRGFFTREQAATGAGLPVAHEDELYLTIAEDRISRQLPTNVSEADLARRYDVSKGALTRALQRLLREGLVERRPGRGWSFAPVLALLEPAFQLDADAARLCEEKHRRILGGEAKKISTIELFEMNAEFHELLARSSGNRFFLQAVQQQNRLRRFVNYHWTYGAERVIRTCQEHMSILEAIYGGDLTWAASLLRRHIEISASINPYDDGTDVDATPQHVIPLDR